MFPELTTDRFLLTKVLPEDQSFLYEGLGDPEAMPYNGVYFSSFEETKAQLDWYEKNRSEGGFNWKIINKETKEPVGVVSVYNFNAAHKKAELGYWLLPRFWQKGIASEVMVPVLEFWKKKGLHRLEAFVEDENIASMRLLEKYGFMREGTMRQCEFKFGRYINLHIYSILF